MWECMLVTKTIEKRLCSSSNGKAKHFKKRWGKVGGGRGGLRLARIKNKGRATQCTFAHLYMSLCTCTIFFSFSVSSSKKKEEKKDWHRNKGRWILQRLHHKTMFA
jgi:hypothetical protein